MKVVNEQGLSTIHGTSAERATLTAAGQAIDGNDALKNNDYFYEQDTQKCYAFVSGSWVEQ